MSPHRPRALYCKDNLDVLRGLLPKGAVLGDVNGSGIWYHRRLARGDWTTALLPWRDVNAYLAKVAHSRVKRRRRLPRDEKKCHAETV